MTQSNTTYQPKEIENRLYAQWEEANYFAPRDGKSAYSIMIPPPNVTGSLHMGHAFQDSLMDILIRYRRMSGDKTLWQVGCDHAGIATQMVVERRLAAQGKSRHDLGREEFLREIWDWKAQSGGQIMRQLRRLGASVDWSRERFTMDDDLSRAVREVFVKLYDDGLIYRGKRLVNWDPVLKTAISDLEVENRDENGFMYQVRYPIVGEDGFIEIATTRPETIPADSAIAVNPTDERYQHLIGKTVQVPLCNREIPVIADDYVDKEFGTGCLKITPAHDFNDYAVGQRHNLPAINIFNPDATVNQNAPLPYQGLSREKAREVFVADLEKNGFLAEVKPHQLTRPYGDRSGVVIEPYLTDQWFVDFTAKGKEILTNPAIAAVREGKIKFVPKNWENTYFRWLENLQDWCISRQLWWGHRIPAWYDKDGNIYVAENEQAVREKYALTADLELHQDEDVLDTWFSSALWPFATQGWPDKTADLAEFYPSSVLVTGFDIIFFWVARMVLMGLYCTGDVPFRDVYIHGLVRDGDGQKMSKSKGNVIDPIDVIDGVDLEELVRKRTENMMQPQKAAKIEKQTRREFPDGIPACGTDALRFYFAAVATSGRDVVFDISRVEGYRNFCNKIWNAARFVEMQIGDEKVNAVDIQDFSAADVWRNIRFNQALQTVENAINTYRFDIAAQAVYEFIWHDYCDWYLELTKPVLSKSATDEKAKAAAKFNLLAVLEKTLRLLHPFMPFITEEIWQKVAVKLGIKRPTVMLEKFPTLQAEFGLDAEKNQKIISEIEWLQQTLLGIRQIRAQMNIAPGKPLTVLFGDIEDTHREYLANLKTLLISLGRLNSAQIAQGEIPESAAFAVGKTTVNIALAGLIDKKAELARLDKEIAKLEQNIARISAQLGNEKFLAKAPAQLVETNRKNLQSDQEQVEILKNQRAKIEKLN